MKQITIEEFIEKIEAEFPEIHKNQLTPTTNFRDTMEWDSVNALMFVVFVNVEYDVIIVAEEFINANTIQDVFDAVKEKVEQKDIDTSKPVMSDEESRAAFGELKDIVENNMDK